MPLQAFLTELLELIVVLDVVGLLIYLILSTFVQARSSKPSHPTHVASAFALPAGRHSAAPSPYHRPTRPALRGLAGCFLPGRHRQSPPEGVPIQSVLKHFKEEL